MFIPLIFLTYFWLGLYMADWLVGHFAFLHFLAGGILLNAFNYRRGVKVGALKVQN